MRETLRKCNSAMRKKHAELEIWKSREQKTKKKREGLDLDNGGQIWYQGKKNTKESVCLILAGMHLSAEIWYIFRYSQNESDTAGVWIGTKH